MQRACRAGPARSAARRPRRERKPSLSPGEFPPGATPPPAIRARTGVARSVLYVVRLISKILLALDDSPCAPRVAAIGGLLASRFGATLHPVRVIASRPGASGVDGLPESAMREATQSLGELARSFMDALVAPPRVRVGEPWRVLVELATESGVDMSVLGARGHGSEPLGATASAVLVHATQDVFVVRDLATRKSVLPPQGGP